MSCERRESHDCNESPKNKKLIEKTKRTFYSLGVPVSKNRELLENSYKNCEKDEGCYRVKYFEADTKVSNIDYSDITIYADNLLHAYYKFYDYLNEHHLCRNPADYFCDGLLEYAVEQMEERNEKYLDEYDFENDTLWLEKYTPIMIS